MLDLRNIAAAYGDTQILFDVSLSVGEGEMVALLGRNGMGKTTTVRVILGLLRPIAGKIEFIGNDISSLRSFEIARSGIGLVPEGRQIFPTLTTEENLLATARGTGAWDLAAIYRLFPRLAERRRHPGRLLSGGEQQMLAIGRALMTHPRLLILDEASEGLAPLMRQEIWTCLAALRRSGLAILVIDKNLDAMLRLADRHVILEKGRDVWSGSSAELAGAPDVCRLYLHV